MDYKIGDIKSVISVDSVDDVNLYLKHGWILLQAFPGTNAFKNPCVNFIMAELPNSTMPQAPYESMEF